MSQSAFKPPIVDLAPVAGHSHDHGAGAWDRIASAIREACEHTGFFYVVGHGLQDELVHELDLQSRFFFSLSHDEKMRIRMSLGGTAWRGYFPLGSELTSGKPDQKEGLYFGSEMEETHPDVVAGRALCGRNLFPERPAGLEPLVTEYTKEMTRLGHLLMRAIAMSLGLSPDYFVQHYTRDPLLLFRIFHYPGRLGAAAPSLWGVGEHTDYGLLTILRQDAVGGLQIKSSDGWIEAAPHPNALVCNIGDMLDRLTLGRYRSTPHRVVNHTAASRLSFAFFFDPNMQSKIRPLASVPAKLTDLEEERRLRWDGRSPYEISGTYGDYLLDKIGRVFPDLKPHGDADSSVPPQDGNNGL